MKFKLFKGIRFGNAYAVQTGDYAGQMFIFIHKKGESYEFLSTPLMENRIVPISEFDFALENGIIEYVKRVPRYVRNIARLKFQENSRSFSIT